MAPMLGRDWALEFALVVSLSAAGVVVVWLGARTRPRPSPPPWWLAAGGAALVVLCVAIALAGGTGARDLWNGLLVGSLRFPGIFVAPPAIEPANLLWAGAALVVAIAVSRFGAATARPAFGIVRVWVGVLIWLLVLRQPSSTFLLGLPLAWLAAEPAREGEAGAAG